MEKPTRTCARCGATYAAETHYCAGCGIGLPGRQASQVTFAAADAGITAVGPPVTSRTFRGLMKGRLTAAGGVLLAPAGVLATLFFSLRVVYGKSESVLTGFTDLTVFALAPLAIGFFLLWRSRSGTAGKKHAWHPRLGPTMAETAEFLDGQPLARWLAVSLGSVLMIIGFALALPIAWMMGVPDSPVPGASRLLPGMASLAAGFLLCRRCLRDR